MLAIRHALGASPGTIHIVAENALNPIIIPLIQKLEASAQPVNVRLGQSLNDDLNWILAARKLVLSNGTIGIAASLISNVVKQAYFFRTDCTGTAHPVDYFLDKNRIDIHVAEDNDGAYIPPRSWLNTKSQRQEMVDFPAERLHWHTQTTSPGA